MQRKFFNIILFFAVGAVGLPNLLQAQEGEVIEERPIISTPVIQDSLPIRLETTRETGQEELDMYPVGPMPDLNISKVPLVEPNAEKPYKKINTGNGEKLKSDEPQSNHSFNFIYYLFYKFKVADTSND